VLLLLGSDVGKGAKARPGGFPLPPLLLKFPTLLVVVVGILGCSTRGAGLDYQQRINLWNSIEEFKIYEAST